ncbi:hypothetical protein PGT21_034574 [Puccinia graminis f. sp. tritici]|uniref:Uncharacterized protein n=1 Tax=Puccinia graminis f. sp. tritici TaxID=56615 RepID=A0A5B0QPV0_PUCGR|nr:hypothetical protein PGT21_034574 [Puccinia graminis f. sp. tritici]
MAHPYHWLYGHSNAAPKHGSQLRRSYSVCKLRVIGRMPSIRSSPLKALKPLKNTAQKNPSKLTGTISGNLNCGDT